MSKNTCSLENRNHCSASHPRHPATLRGHSGAICAAQRISDHSNQNSSATSDLERVIPDIRARCQVCAHLAHSSVTHAWQCLVTVNIFCTNSCATTLFQLPTFGAFTKTLYAAGGHTADAPALSAACDGHLRPWHQGWTGHLFRPEDAYPRCACGFCHGSTSAL